MIRRLLAVFLSIAVTLIAVHPAQAHHYIYLAEDPEWQKTNWPGTENGVFVKWATDGSTLKYNVMMDSMKADVAAAFSNWYAAIPLPYQETTNPGEANIFIAEVIAPCAIATWDGCYEPYDFDNREPQKASYTAKARIYVKPGIANRRAVIAHELGYFYGLHKRFIDDANPGPNPSELSVRDLPQSDLQEGPTLVDETRVRAFWGKRDTYQRNLWPYDTFEWPKGDLAITGVKYQDIYTGKYVATFKWRDLAWTEQVHQMGAYWGYYDYGQNRIIWDVTPFYENAHMADIGLNFYLGAYRVDLGDKYMEDNIFPRDYKPAGYVIMCGKPYFPGVVDWGSFRCSNPLDIP